MGTDFKCGCRVSGAWYLCRKHEDKIIELIAKDEVENNTVSDVVRDKKGSIKKFINERPMEKAK